MVGDAAHQLIGTAAAPRQGVIMTNSTPRRTLELNRSVLAAGVVLLCVGGVVWLSGAVLSSIALAQAAKRWIDDLDESPADMARKRMHQLKVAASAGANAWRDESR
jgi:hypothetical protein